MPYHAIFCAPNAKLFHFADYALPSYLAGVTFRYYCVFTEKYLPVPDTINLIGRGKFMVLINTDVLLSHCPRIDEWEEWARDLAQWEEEEGMFVTCLQQFQNVPHIYFSFAGNTLLSLDLFLSALLD